MSIVQTQWWCLELPDEWSAEMEDDSVIIADHDGVGEITISVVKKNDGSVQREDLRDFAEELIDQGEQSQRIEFGSVNDSAVSPPSGLLFAYDDQEGAWREWYLGCGALLIYITYNCDIEHRLLDDAIVDEILSTLLVLHGVDEQEASEQETNGNDS